MAKTGQVDALPSAGVRSEEVCNWFVSQTWTKESGTKMADDNLSYDLIVT